MFDMYVTVLSYGLFMFDIFLIYFPYVPPGEATAASTTPATYAKTNVFLAMCMRTPICLPIFRIFFAYVLPIFGKSLKVLPSIRV